MILEEWDESGEVRARYTIPTEYKAEGHVHIERSSRRAQESLGEVLGDMFLPAGYPSSVTDDYAWYQIFDSLQAFSSSIAGLLASRATLEGFGVGDASASADKALLLTIGQDVFGRLSTILFAWRLGTALEPEAKMYRLAADVFNDSAMILDCLTPALPQDARIAALCCSSVLRALCGTAAGGAKAALSVHFARAGNIGDLNAKDSSQETVIGLMGMLCGYYVVPLIQSRRATWIALFTLIGVHLAMNYFAVRAVTMHTLNRQRTNIVWSEYRALLSRDPSTSKTPNAHRLLTPKQVALREYVFQRNGLLWDASSHRNLGRCILGSSLLTILHNTNVSTINEIVALFESEAYILWVDHSYKSCRPSIHICLKSSSSQSSLTSATLPPRCTLKAWIHAFEFASRWDNVRISTNDRDGDRSSLISIAKESLEFVNAHFETFTRGLAEVGWDDLRDCLITGSPCTIRMVLSDDLNNKKVR